MFILFSYIFPNSENAKVLYALSWNHQFGKHKLLNCVINVTNKYKHCTVVPRYLLRLSSVSGKRQHPQYHQTKLCPVLLECVSTMSNIYPMVTKGFYALEHILPLLEQPFVDNLTSTMHLLGLSSRCTIVHTCNTGCIYTFAKCYVWHVCITWMALEVF